MSSYLWDTTLVFLYPNDISRLYCVQGSKSGRNKRRQVFDLIRPSNKDQQPDLAARKVLLMRKALVYRQQYVIAGNLGGIQQLAILSPLQPRPLGSVRFVNGKAVS